jgi:hypoxanthine phosphoribosyltransferase
VKIVFTQQQIRAATVGLAEAINRDHEGQEVHLLGILKGSFIFMADLVRQLRVPCSVDFVRLSSYGSRTESAGVVEEVLGRKDPLCGRHVVVVEEIVDSGETLAKLLRDLESEEPASVKVCALVDKTGRRQRDVRIDYRGFVVEEGFLVGYGLDFNEAYRALPDIYVLEEGEV